MLLFEKMCLNFLQIERYETCSILMLVCYISAPRCLTLCGWNVVVSNVARSEVKCPTPTATPTFPKFPTPTP